MLIKTLAVIILTAATVFACPPVSYVSVANFSSRPIEAEIKFKEKVREGRKMVFSNWRSLDYRKNISLDRIMPWLAFDNLETFANLTIETENKILKVQLQPKEAVRFEDFNSDWRKHDKESFYLESVKIVDGQKTVEYNGDSLFAKFGQRPLNYNDTFFYLQYR